jgi:hypothetical protein
VCLETSTVTTGDCRNNHGVIHNAASIPYSVGMQLTSRRCGTLHNERRLDQTLRMVPLAVPQCSWNQTEARSRPLGQCRPVVYRVKHHGTPPLSIDKCCLVANSPDRSHNGPTKCGCGHTWFSVAVLWKKTCLDAVCVPEEAKMAYRSDDTVSLLGSRCITLGIVVARGFDSHSLCHLILLLQITLQGISSTSSIHHHIPRS